MKTKFHYLFIPLVLFAGIHHVSAQGTAFTYEGQLQNNGSPASGTYNLTLSLFNTNTSGVALAGPVTNNGVFVSNGLFMVLIDFGPGVFTGATNWLEIAVETNGVNTFTTLTPRQRLAPVPYAIFANTASNLSGTLPVAHLSGAIGNSQLANGSITVTAGTGLSGGGTVALGGSTTLNNAGVVSVTGNADITASMAGGVVTLGDTATSASTPGAIVKRDASGNFSAGTITANLAGNATTATSATTATTAATASAVGTNAVNAAALQNSAVTGAKIASGQVVKSLTAGASTLYDNVTLTAGNNVTITPNGQTLTIAAIGGASGSWSLTGNAGTTPGVDFVGTTDNHPLEFWVNYGRALRLEPGGASTGAPNVIGGSPANFVSGGVVGATISGGGATNYGGNTFFISNTNSVTADFGTVGGGYNNTSSGGEATVGGGDVNTASGVEATVGGGYGNTASGVQATVGGGFHNTASGVEATVGGGESNNAGNDATVSGGDGNTASGVEATVGGGGGNTASGGRATVGGGQANKANIDYATVGGGYGNTASGFGAFIGGGGFNGGEGGNFYPGNLASGWLSVIGGGSGNTANNDFATIGGGQYNVATISATIGGGLNNTNYSEGGTIAGGQNNICLGDQGGTIGGGEGNSVSGASDGYGCATVGGGLYNTASGDYATVAGGYANVAGGQSSFAAGFNARATNQGAFVWSDSSSSSPFTSTNNNSFNIRAAGGCRIYTTSSGASGAGVYLAANGGNSWTSISDRNAKKNFQPVNNEAVLEKLSTIPVQRWNYKWEKDTDVPNIGPMAQDFIDAFYPGRDDKGISTLEFDGVELAAIQGLNQKLNEKDAEIQTLKTQHDLLAQRLNELEAAVEQLATQK